MKHEQFLAGMHLFAAGDEMRRQVVKKVEEECPKFVMPVHCTGMEAICMIKANLGDKCLIASTGDRFTSKPLMMQRTYDL